MQNYHTGMFLNFDKSMILFRIVRGTLQNDFNTIIACGPKNAQNTCELILQNIPNKVNSDFVGAKDLLKKYITILEFSSWIPPKAAINTSKVQEPSHHLLMCDVYNQAKHEKSNKPVAAATDMMHSLEVIDLEHEDMIDDDCNDVIIVNDSNIDKVQKLEDAEVCNDVIIVDDSNIEEVQKLEDAEVLSDSSIYFVDKSLSSFESTVQSGKKKRKSKTKSLQLGKKIKNNKVKSVKQKTLFGTSNSKEILKEPNGQNNFTDVKTIDISSSADVEIISNCSSCICERNEQSDYHASQKLELNYNKTINLIDDNSDEEVVEIVEDEKPGQSIILLDSPVPAFHSKKHLQVTVRDTCLQISSGCKEMFFSNVTSNQPILKKKKLKNNKLIKTAKKQDKNSLFKHCKKLPPTVIIGTKKKKHKKGLFKEWARPAHLSSTLTKTCTVVNSTCSAQSVGTNVYNPNTNEVQKEGLRPIVIDGSNVAISHGKGDFSLRGVQICIDYFLKRGHRHIKVFIPRFRMNQNNHDELNRMEKSGTLILTPSRKVDGRMVVPYDDRFIIQYAAETGGVVVSSDYFRDLLNENPAWKETIDRRLLMFTWVDDFLMFPQDPLGRKGPTLDEFLRY